MQQQREKLTQEELLKRNVAGQPVMVERTNEKPIVEKSFEKPEVLRYEEKAQVKTYEDKPKVI